MKKIKALLASSLLACFMAVCVLNVFNPAIHSEAIAGINYYINHSRCSTNWKAKASATTKIGGVVASSCMKAALIGSGAGPIGSALAVAAVGL